MRLNTNPENGRRSGDVWSIPIKECAIEKGDTIYLKNGEGNNRGEGIFLGVSDEFCEESERKQIIVLSKGVFPFNKRTDEEIKIGDRLMRDGECGLRLATHDEVDNNEHIATAYNNAGKTSTVLFAKIHSKL